MSRVVRKPDFCICENKDADTAKLISAFVFATQKVQFLYFLNTKFQASSHLVWLYSLVCVGPDRKPRRPVFSQRGSILVSSQSMKTFKVLGYHETHLKKAFMIIPKTYIFVRKNKICL